METLSSCLKEMPDSDSGVKSQSTVHVYTADTLTVWLAKSASSWLTGNRFDKSVHRGLGLRRSGQALIHYFELDFSRQRSIVNS